MNRKLLCPLHGRKDFGLLSAKFRVSACCGIHAFSASSLSSQFVIVYLAVHDSSWLVLSHHAVPLLQLCIWFCLASKRSIFVCLWCYVKLCLRLFAVCQTQVQLLFLVQCLLMSDETWDVFHSADRIVDRKVDIAAIQSKYWPALTRVYCCHFEVLLQETDVPLHVMDAESSVRFALQSVVSFVPLQLHSAPQAIQDLLASPQAALGEGTEKRREIGTYFIIIIYSTVYMVWTIHVCIYIWYICIYIYTWYVFSYCNFQCDCCYFMSPSLSICIVIMLPFILISYCPIASHDISWYVMFHSLRCLMCSFCISFASVSRGQGSHGPFRPYRGSADLVALCACVVLLALYVFVRFFYPCSTFCSFSTFGTLSILVYLELMYSFQYV